MLAAVGLLLMVLPLIGLVGRVPWSDLGGLLGEPVVRQALGLSLVSSLSATLLSALLGIPLAWILARVSFPGRGLVRGLVLLPLVLPPVVGGTALLLALGRRGVVGEPLYELTGLVLPFSVWGVILAVTFVSFPFTVLTVEGALSNLNPRYEAAAASLGAKPGRVIRTVTLPLVAPTLWSGLLLTWARALGEFGATVTFAGNLTGRTQTLPLAVYVALENNRDLAVVLSLVMVAISLAVLVGLRQRWWRVW